MRITGSLLAMLLATVATPALAVDQPDALHTETSAEIIVTAPFERERFSLATAVTVLQGTDLARESRSTLGETLARQPGVSSTFFGPNASRPILRGLDAERVRVLTDGIGSFDVSNTSVDHAVAINPLLVSRVEVIRGPAALLYGSGAIGGVVNVQDTRIPREIPDEPLHVEAAANFGSAAEERGGGVAIDLPLGKTGLVAHADASFLRTSDYRSGGFVYSPAQRALGTAAGGEAADQAALRGNVPNSDARTWDVAGGLAWIGADGANFGFSVSHLENNYGIPNALPIGLGEGEGPEQDIRLDMRQTRVDVRAAVPLGGLFETLRLRGGWADYRHDELEDTGEIGTSFFNKAWEARAELVQREQGAWKGASGVQYLSRNFESVGAEAYIPRNETRQIALFTLQEFDVGGGLKIDVGGRYEHSDVRSDVIGISRNFDAFSGSFGVSLRLSDGWNFAVSTAHSQRAPSAEELFANGGHAATQAFEVGNPVFLKERSTGIEAVLRGRGDLWNIELSSFFTRFSNFIYLNPNGDIEDGLPVFQYQQSGARFWGFEAEGAYTLAELGDTSIAATGLIDFVRADILGGVGPVPRIPPLRMIGGLEASGGSIGGRIEIEHAIRQKRLASFEADTPAFTMVNASLTWKPLGTDNGTAVILSANNVFDVEARRHASFLKNVSPLMGRDFRLAVRFSF